MTTSVYRVQGPDGKVYRLQGPANASPDEIAAAAEQAFGAPAKSAPQQIAPPSMDDLRKQLAQGATLQFATPFGRVDTGIGLPQGVTEFLAGAGRRITDIATLGNNPYRSQRGVSDKTLSDLITGGAGRPSAERLVDDALDASGYATAGGIAADLATLIGGGTALRGAGAAAQSVAPVIGGAMRTAGQALVGPQSLKQAVTAGAAYGGATTSGGLTERLEGAGMGGLGGALGRAVVAAPGAISRALSPQVSPEVAALAKRAQDLGIGVRADQVANSRPLNAVSAALDYVPFSGSAPAKIAQQKDFNRAIARTIGENTDNPALAVDQAAKRLGGEFDRVLQGNRVAFDNALQTDLQRIASEASTEMTDAQFGVIAKQLANLQSKVANGEIDGAAAYNIKKQLDRLAKSPDSSLSFYAKELRGSLFDALNRSLGPDEAAKFAMTRQQWGNLREIERLVPAGAEADISAARLANAKGRIRSDDLRELSDIAGQFLKGRIGDSGTAQRVQMGAAPIAFYLDPIATAGGMSAQIGAARLANSLMGAQPVVNYLREGAAPGARAALGRISANPELQYAQPAVNALLANSYAR